MAIEVKPSYGSINAVRDICEPWIELHGGDEWGESMRDAHGASHTSYGFTDEDCATIAQIMINNLLVMMKWLIADGVPPWGYGYDEESGRTALARTQSEAAESRDYWLNGGNLGEWGTTKDDAKHVIDQMPIWLFEDADINPGDLDV